MGTTRADALYERVLSDYGDDSVAQLGGVHLACEGASNLLTKVLEWGRLMAYLEQSTRYVPYTDRPGGAWKYHLPAELDGHPLRARYVETLDRAFDTYARWIEPMQRLLGRTRAARAGEAEGPWRLTIRAKALDSLARPPARGHAVQCGHIRHRAGLRGATPAHARAPPARGPRLRGVMLTELRKVIPAFLSASSGRSAAGCGRNTSPTPRWQTRRGGALLAGIEPEPRAEVTLTDWDPDGEVKVVAAALYAVSDLPDDQLLALVRKLGPEERPGAAAYTGTRENRRHKPGRAFERTATASTCWATTAPSAISSVTGCSRWSGSRSRRGTAGWPETRSRRPGPSRTGPA